MTQQFDPNQEHENCGTVECCMQCDTADTAGDWYLVAINPWHKTICNPVTGQTKHILYKENNE